MIEFPLIDACKSRNIELIKSLIDDPNTNINEADRAGLTPIYYARDNVLIVKLLLETLKISINWRNAKGETIFFSACKYGYIEVVKILLEETSVDVTITNNDNNSALCSACDNNHLDVVKLLLEDAKIDPCHEGRYGYTAFHIACERGNLSIVKLLLDECDTMNPNKSNSVSLTPFLAACRANHESVVRFLLSHDKIDPTYGNTLIYLSCTRHNLAMIKILLEDDRFDVNDNGSLMSSAFEMACLSSNIDVIEYMISRCDVIIPSKIYSDEVEAIISKYR